MVLAANDVPVKERYDCKPNTRIKRQFHSALQYTLYINKKEFEAAIVY
jgi:hypothetical protein